MPAPLVSEVVTASGLKEAGIREDPKAVLSALNGLFWMWYAGNTERKLTTIKFWFISKTIYLKDLRMVFETIFGPPMQGF